MTALGDTVRAAVEALATLDEGDEFVHAVDAVCDAAITGGSNIIFIGVGKSGLVAQKTAASFRSFGLPAFYLHAGDCAHGDLGAISIWDTVVAFTHSGSTQEVVSFLEALDSKLGRNYRLVLVTSSKDAVEALKPDAVLAYSANEYLGHVPTASCIAQLTYGDALLANVVDNLGITLEDFGCNHPGGSLGRQLAK